MEDQLKSQNFEELLENLVIEQARKIINHNNYTKSILSTLPMALVTTDNLGDVRSFNNSAKKLLDLSNGKKLTDCFLENSSLQNKIENCLYKEEKYTLNSQKITINENIVNVYLQPLYDDESIVCGILMAIEDQTYVSFLQDSILRYSEHSENSKIIAEIVATKKLSKQIETSSKTEDTVLFTGDSGTGKSFFAHKLHEGYGFTTSDPFIVIDCKTIKENNPCKFLFGNIDIDNNNDGEIAFRSVSDYGAVHLAQNGSLVLKNIEFLPPDAQESLFRYLNRKDTGFLKELNARVILTVSIDLSALKEEIDNKNLIKHLGDNIINVPTLWKRKKEIIPLANLFLSESNNGKDKKFSPDAENLLLSKHYTYNNVKELKEAVELAAEVSKDNEISSECIFIGPKEESSTLELNISQFPMIKWLIKDKVLKHIRLGILLIFMVIIILSITYNNTEFGHIVNAFIWGLWWPGIIVFLLLGRLWCSICPLSTAASFFKRLFSFELKPPSWLKKTAHFIIPFGFVTILIVEYVFHMNMNPVASGLFLISLILLAVIFSVIFQRETWCRYVCPLGGLGAIYSIGGVFNVKANPDVCASKCKTHECNKGSETQAGCPVFHHPLYAEESHVCKLCFNCLKSCPNSSAKLTMQFPFRKIWRQKELQNTLSIFAFTLFFMAPLLIATKSFSEIIDNTLFIIYASLAFVFSGFISTILSKLESKDIDKNRFILTRISLALMLLAWGPLAAFQFAHIPVLNSMVLQNTNSVIWDILFSSSGLSLIKILQSTTVFIAAIFGWITIQGIKKQNNNSSKMITSILSVVFILYTAINIYMIIIT